MTLNIQKPERRISIEIAVFSKMENQQEKFDILLQIPKFFLEFSSFKANANFSNDFALSLINRCGEYIYYIQNPTEDMHIAAIKQTPLALKYIDKITENIIKASIEHHGYAIKYITNPTTEMCVNAVKYSYLELKDIKSPTKRVLKTAIKHNYLAILEISYPSEEIEHYFLSLYNKDNIDKLNSFYDEICEKIDTLQKLSDDKKRFMCLLGKVGVETEKTTCICGFCDKKPREEIIKYKKKITPKAIRVKVWDTYIGKIIGASKCFCCKIADIDQMNWDCGHVIAERLGGEMTIENLRPICKKCNSKMRTTNMFEYMKKIKTYSSPDVKQTWEEEPKTGSIINI